MRLHRFVFLLAALAFSSSARADEWFSRSGACFDLRGHWRVDRDQSGTWTGDMRLIGAGGPCTRPTHSEEIDEVRAVIVGDDFFAQRRNRSGPGICMFQGRLQGDEVRGHEVCSGVANPMDFTLHLGRGPDERDEERREERREPEPYRR